MKSIKQYQHELDSLKSEVAAATGSQPLQVKEHALALEHAIQMDLRAVSTQFSGRSVSHIGNLNKQGGKEKAEQGRRLLEEETQRLQPLKDLLLQIQEIISKLPDGK